MNLTETNIRIIQSSQTRTGSTLLTNILYGLFTPTLPVRFCNKFNSNDQTSIDKYINEKFIIKTHIDQLLQLENHFKQYELYFVCSVRPEINKTTHLKYQNQAKHLLIIDYKYLKEENVVEYLYDQLQNFLPLEIFQQANKKTAIQRVKIMNERYEQIKNMPFEYWDPFFKIHGHHRNRDAPNGRPDK